jgi:hypothetical protein
MAELRVFLYFLIAVLLLVRFIINNKIFNVKNKTKYPAFELNQNLDSFTSYFNNIFVFWLNPPMNYKTLATISNIMGILLIVLIVYAQFLW